MTKTSTGRLVKESKSAKSATQGISAKDVLGHFMDECEKDPLYVTKIIVTALGKNIADYVFRVFIYLAVYFVLTTYFGLTQGVAGLFVILVIISYYSIASIKDRIFNSIKKKNGN